jgi:hypothetical protein
MSPGTEKGIQLAQWRMIWGWGDGKEDLIKVESLCGLAEGKGQLSLEGCDTGIGSRRPQ